VLKSSAAPIYGGLFNSIDSAGRGGRYVNTGVSTTIHMSKHLLGEHDKALHLSLTVEDIDEMIARLEQKQAQQLGVNRGEPREVKTIEVQAPTSRPAEC
jgi:hypothetical protein